MEENMNSTHHKNVEEKIQIS